MSKRCTACLDVCDESGSFVSPIGVVYCKESCYKMSLKWKTRALVIAKREKCPNARLDTRSDGPVRCGTCHVCSGSEVKYTTRKIVESKDIEVIKNVDEDKMR